MTDNKDDFGPQHFEAAEPEHGPEATRRSVQAAKDLVGVPTQVAHPWKASIRTFLQTWGVLLFAVAVAGPQLVSEIPAGYLPDEVYAWLLAAATGLAVGAGILARIMAHPAVNAILIKLGLGTGVENEVR